MWRDEILLLDMLLAAEDALEFVANLNRAQFAGSKLHQNAVDRQSQAAWPATWGVLDGTTGPVSSRLVAGS